MPAILRILLPKLFASMWEYTSYATIGVAVG